MIWFKKKSKKTGKVANTRRRKLLFESLEGRAVMASGVVNVLLPPFGPPGTALALFGDGSNNDVEIHQTLNVNEYTIQGKNGTLLQLNNVGATFPSITVNGVNDVIFVNLLNGNDNFTFSGRPDGQQSNIPTDLVIVNSDGSNVNVLSDVLINQDLTVTKNAGSSGYSELQILDSTIIGATTVNNVGTGGDTKTLIDNSWLQGGAMNASLVLVNGEGADINNIRGNSQFGLGPFPIANPVVLIVNGDGASQTTFTGQSATAGFGTTTVYGALTVVNGDNIPGFLDLVTFDSTNVLGPTTVINGEGNTSTEVTGSTLGSHLVLANTNTPLIGGPLTILNESGYDEFTMTDSTVPWGLYIDNNLGNPAANWGSKTSISLSRIGTGPYGPRLSTPGDAMIFLGDNGRDLLNVDSTTLNGRLDLQLRAGNNELNVTNNTVMAGLYLVTLGGNDKVLIDKSRILVDVYVRLGAGADEFYVRNLVWATDWPSSLLGSIDIDGELGVDRTNLGTLVPLGFELLVP